MSYTLTLISTPEKPSIDAEVCARFSEYLDETATWQILAEGEAAQLSVAFAQPELKDQELKDQELKHQDLKALTTRLRGQFAELEADIIITPEAPRQARLLVADMESTIIVQECLDELAELIHIRPQIEDITRRAMRGEIDFEPALKERVALLAGLPESALETVYRERVTLMPGAATLIATMRAHGAFCALVSGGFTYFAERIAARLAFDACQSNQLDMANGQLLGTVAEPILGRGAKADILQKIRAEKSIDTGATMAVGDGSNDLAMLAAAGMGVAFRAKPAVAEAADIRVDYGDLTALLYIQGYRKSDFVQP